MIPLLKEESMEKEHVEHHLGHPGDSVEQHSVQVSFFRSGQFRSFQVSSGQVPDLIGRSGQFSSGESHLSSRPWFILVLFTTEIGPRMLPRLLG